MRDRELLAQIDGLGHPRILIVGDLILDRYVAGDVARISPEAPIPVLAARHIEERLGGAGNVAANLRAMEAEVSLLGVVGKDALGDRLQGLLEGIGVDASGLLRDEQRPTTGKTRFTSGGQQILRVDWEDAQPVTPELMGGLVDHAHSVMGEMGAVILSDYGKGVLGEPVLQGVIAAARAHGVPVLVDPKGTDYGRYLGATLVTPNRKEAEEALGRKLRPFEELPRGADELIETAELDAAVITLGADGIYYRSKGGTLGEKTGRIAPVARAVFDVTGAGDTVISHLALALAAGLGLESAVRLANQAAGIVVGRRGAASVTRRELKAAFGSRSGGASLILERSELPELLSEWRAEGKRIVFTNGCFDIVHAGHIDYLRTARSRGDALIVALNDDESVHRLKGEGRPINKIADRMRVLAALEMVDAVVAFSEDTPLAIVEEITPDVLVKGQDWEDKGVVGREWVEQHGGEVYLAPLLPGRSTTAIANRLRDGEASSTS